jgi:hypothetical protein
LLGPDARDVELIRAAARNHVSWMTRAGVATGGEVVRERGVTWIAPPRGGGARAVFPRRRSPRALPRSARPGQ